jgi:tetratricopeptide (TPR) repeat protein
MKTTLQRCHLPVSLLMVLSAAMTFVVFADELTTEEIAKRNTSSVMLLSDENSLGTGFILSEDGVLVTNFHVISAGKKMVAKSHTGGLYEVQAVLATDKVRDIAILKLGAKNLNALELAAPTTVSPGSKIVVIGNPVGLESTVSEGIVSAKRQLGDYGEVLQITAPISPGSSGSPVLNKEGKVVGIATFKRIDGESLNFAIPSYRITDLLMSLKNGTPATAAEGYTPSRDTEGSPEQDAKLAVSTQFTTIKTLEDTGNYFEMLKEAKKLVALYPESALAHRILSDAFYYTDLNDDAASCAKKAIDLDPANPRGWNNLGIILASLGAEEESKRVYAHAIKVAPDDAKLLIEYAGQIAKSNQQLALSALESAYRLLLEGKGTDLESASYHLQSELVDSLRDAGGSEIAYEAACRFLQANPNDPPLWVAKAAAALAVAKYDEVRPALSQAFKLNPAYKNDARLHTMVGYLELNLNNPTAAQQAFERAYDIVAQNPSLDPNAGDIIEGVIEAICSKSVFADDDISDLGFYTEEMQKIDAGRAEELKNQIIKLIKARRR